MRWSAARVGCFAGLLGAAPAAAEEPASPPTARFGDVDALPDTPAPPSPPRRSDAAGVAPRPPSALAPPPSTVSPGAAAPAPPSPSSYVHHDVVDPFASVEPPPAPPASGPIHEVDDLLIVNPYSGLLAGARDGPRPRYFAPPAVPSAPGMLLVLIPTGFRGAVYLNGVALPPAPAPTPMLPGEHAVTVVPQHGEAFTVWVAVGAGESRRFRFALGGGRSGRATRTDSVSSWFPTSGAELK